MELSILPPRDNQVSEFISDQKDCASITPITPRLPQDNRRQEGVMLMFPVSLITPPTPSYLEREAIETSFAIFPPVSWIDKSGRYGLKPLLA
jgi:hypothetical protein